ncbi:hypothetical protein BWQ96_03814 [Gracilariopsis chorda]|uniref:2Fe-2S ferredoxin-type domain-containing protein n=1 Tax=Gracilariopsis chorda TaxID=448386 RepID=A0A2V3IZ64_9FLOR|nr:hypothetical protein BWQ96_03814 [Gracilariopsis chorda]|eukprot:PXF46420.1 hypothetical protein BWQ96_03814 [Gracilariopsis chorda]
MSTPAFLAPFPLLARPRASALCARRRATSARRHHRVLASDASPSPESTATPFNLHSSTPEIPSPSFNSPQPPHSQQPPEQHAPPETDPTPPSEQPPYQLMPGEIAVRFINTPSGNEVIAAANVGDNLLNVSDSVGVHIPRACQSGLCGSCTCDIVDVSAQDGRQTVRACQTAAVPVDGSRELVVDVARTKTTSAGKNPMARFENLDTEYVAGAAPRRKGAFVRQMECSTCSSKGDLICYACDGRGEDSQYMCGLCRGSGHVRCGDCQGTGIVTVRRR